MSASVLNQGALALKNMTVAGVPVVPGGGGSTAATSVALPQAILSSSGLPVVQTVPLNGLVAGNVYQVFWRLTSPNTWTSNSFIQTFIFPPSVLVSLAGDTTFASDFNFTLFPNPPTFMSNTITFVAPVSGNYSLSFFTQGSTLVIALPFLIKLNGT